MFSLYEILESGQVVILGDKNLGVLITWNGHSMLNLWQGDSKGKWDNNDIRTCYDINGNVDKAIRECQDWIIEISDQNGVAA